MYFCFSFVGLGLVLGLVLGELEGGGVMMMDGLEKVVEDIFLVGRFGSKVEMQGV